MNKEQLINRIIATTPYALCKREPGESGTLEQTALFLEGKDAARSAVTDPELGPLTQWLLDATTGSSDTADPFLLWRLHDATLRFSTMLVERTSDSQVAALIEIAHRAVITRLREVAQELNITYQAPNDPLLEVSAEENLEPVSEACLVQVQG